MKILQINALFAPHRYGGAEIFLEHFAERLIQLGHEVSVACLVPTAATPANGATPPANGAPRLHPFALRNIYWPFEDAPRPSWRKAVWHLRNSFGSGGAVDIDALLRRERPDLVHTHNLTGFTSNVWNIVRTHRVPLVHTLHDYQLLCPATTMSQGAAACHGQCSSCRALSWSKLGNSKAVDAVVGCSRFVLEQHLARGYFPRASQHVIHNGDVRSPQPAPRASRSAEQSLRIGYLGRLTQIKGIELMLDALHPLVADGHRLLVGGKGETGYESLLRARYGPRGVQFLGRVDAAGFLAEVDVIVAPSLWHEPCPLVVVEAIRSGVPVVAAAVGGIPEIVVDGKCGLLFEPGNAQQLLAVVRKLSADRELHCRLVAACRAETARLAFETTVRSYLGVYHRTFNLSVN